VPDEAEGAPERFPARRVIVDRHPDRRVLVLGSAAPEMLRQSSETLAASRSATCHPFALDEVGVDTVLADARPRGAGALVEGLRRRHRGHRGSPPRDPHRPPAERSRHPTEAPMAVL
jgi:hypothetical protein